MSLSTLRARFPPSPDSLTSLTDDSLLLILCFFSVPQLLAFLSISRRLNHLIVQYTLPPYRAILMQVTCTSVPSRGSSLKPQFDQSFFFSRRFHKHTDIYFSQSFGRLPVKALRSGQVHQALSSSLPLHLPHLLPRLQSLTFAYYLEGEPLRREATGNGPLDAELETKLRESNLSCQPLHIEPVSNGPLIGYLQSNWRQSLVSLELHLLNEYRGERPYSNEILFDRLNQLSALRHLSLLFSVWYYSHERLLPDSMPVLGQLVSFALYKYRARNVTTLLEQLGPALTSLSLYFVICSEEDFLSFLRSKPTYRQTLRTLEIHLKDKNNRYLNTTPRLSTLANYHLPLERLLSSLSLVAGELFTCFNVLSHNFARLRELGYLSMTINELRALRDDHSRISLPRLPSLRRVYLTIKVPRFSTDFQPGELFDSHLPLLGAVFCAVEYIEIQFEIQFEYSDDGPPRRTDSDRALLKEQLLAKMKVHFAGARTCKGEIFPGPDGARPIRLLHWSQEVGN